MLGFPIPCDEHATSVCIPTYEDTVGYEEGLPRVRNAMKLGYPRFKIHAVVEMLCNFMSLPKTRRSFGDLDDLHADEAPAKSIEEEEEEEGEILAGLDYACYVFPTLQVALRFQSFMQSGTTTTSEISIQSVHYEYATAVYFPKTFAAKAKAYWQHTGEIISSRMALDALRDLGDRLTRRIPVVTPVFSPSGRARLCKSDSYLPEGITPDSDEWERICTKAKKMVEERILQQLCEPPHHANDGSIHLTTSGMAAIFSALRLAKARADAAGMGVTSVVVFGFPYLDTLKMMQRAEFNEGGVTFLGNGDQEDVSRLEALLGEQGQQQPRVCAVFTEFPSNPLLKLHDMRRLTALATKHDFLLVVDDTIAGFAPVDLLRGDGGAVCVDLLCSSLTKSFSGRGDVLAGSLVINPSGRHAAQLRHLSSRLSIAPLYGPDVVALEHNSRDYLSRTLQTSRTAAALASWLSSQPGVARVYYPQSSGELVSALRRMRNRDREEQQEGDAGLGCLFSVVLADPGDANKTQAQEDRESQVFFDALRVWKGPSLGTNFTLSCMFTLLAHYDELDWAETFGVDRRLVRVSVGLESPERLQQVFSQALVASRHLGAWRVLHRVLVEGRGMPLPTLPLVIAFLYL